jgi:hypothetical protein
MRGKLYVTTQVQKLTVPSKARRNMIYPYRPVQTRRFFLENADGGEDQGGRGRKERREEGRKDIFIH